MNLTWEIEELQLDRDVGELVDGAAPPPIPLSLQHAFVVYYCELQSWGPQRCKSKVLKENENHIDSGLDEDVDDEDRRRQEFSMVVDNLRMATKYSFHVRQLSNAAAEKPKGREMDEEEEEEMDSNAIDKGQTIIIPTKGCKFAIIFLRHLKTNYLLLFQSLPTPRNV